MKPLTVFPNAERVVVDYLAGALAGRGQDVTVGVGLPGSWTTAAKPHVGVFLDGTVRRLASAAASVRVTTWAAGPTPAFEVAELAQALLLAHPGTGLIRSVNPLLGLFTGRDPDNRAPLASFTARVNLRPTVL